MDPTSSRSSFARAITSGGNIPGAWSMSSGYSVRAATWKEISHERGRVGRSWLVHDCMAGCVCDPEGGLWYLVSRRAEWTFLRVHKTVS